MAFFKIRRFIVATLLTLVVAVISVVLAGMVHLQATTSSISSDDLTRFLGFSGKEGSILEMMGNEVWILIVTGVVLWFINYVALWMGTPRMHIVE